MASNSTTIHKLQQAINSHGGRLLYSTSQFYSDETNRPITIYQIRESFWDEEKRKNRSRELFKSASQIQIVLFLRDYWYVMNGKELPTNNETWNKIRPTITLNKED